MKQALCSIPTCMNFQRYCRIHRMPIEKEVKPIAKVSASRKEVNKEYEPKAKAYRKANPLCVLKLEGCRQKTECVHHSKGKDSVEMLLDETFWKASCWHCNYTAEANDLEARQKDIKLSKFNDKLTNA